MRFEWDENKRRRNLVKHGVDFADAVEVFADPMRVEVYDDKHSENEDRWQAIGCVDAGGLLCVVHTERARGVIRLISARKATKHEREAYYQS